MKDLFIFGLQTFYMVDYFKGGVDDSKPVEDFGMSYLDPCINYNKDGVGNG